MQEGQAVPLTEHGILPCFRPFPCQTTRRSCVGDDDRWAGKEVQSPFGRFHIYTPSQPLRNVLLIAFPNLQTKNQVERLYLIHAPHYVEYNMLDEVHILDTTLS